MNWWIEQDVDARMKAVDAAQDLIKERMGVTKYHVPWSVLEEAIYVATRTIEKHVSDQ